MQAKTQADITRRFHVRFTSEALNDHEVYDCSFTDKGEKTIGATTPDEALLEFHRYMQRKCWKKPSEYKITGLWDTYSDATGRVVKRDYPVFGGPNPNVMPKEREPKFEREERAMQEKPTVAPWIEDWLKRKGGTGSV